MMLLPLALAACSQDDNTEKDPDEGGSGTEQPEDGSGTEQPSDGLYPSNPNFDTLSGFESSDPTSWGEAKAHDPSVIEADGVFYVFSTDNEGTYGYQVRKSEDLIHWEWVGNAIEDCGTASTASSLYAGGNGGLQQVYNVISQDSNWSTKGAGDNKGTTWTLWAPDVVKGSDGKFWLYGCWTADFGQGHSVIFLCKADKVTGPYTYDSMLLYSYDGWPTNNSNPNAIDPQIYYVGDKMYMAYGSFKGGTWTIELDPETGRRADGLSGDDLLPAGGKSASERYGTRLVNGTVTEGPTINYHEDVAIYPTDLDSIKNYDASKLTAEDRYYMMGSANDLSKTYNMRSFYSTSPVSGFTSLVTAPTAEENLGNRVSGSFSWRTRSGDRGLSFDFFAPGHNDMITTSEGKNLIVYHNRKSFGSGEHYLFVSTYAFNSRGDLVMNPNRYAGETLRKVEESELAGKEFYYVLVNSNEYSQLANGGYAQKGFVLGADNKVMLDGEEAGEWYLYGDNYVYIELNDVAYYGVAMPAYIQKNKAGGISVSLLSENGKDTLFMNVAA